MAIEEALERFTPNSMIMGVISIMKDGRFGNTQLDD